MRSKMEVVGETPGSESQIQPRWGHDFSCTPRQAQEAANTEVHEGAAEPRPYPRPTCVGLKDRGQHVVLSLPRGRLCRDAVPTMPQRA